MDRQSLIRPGLRGEILVAFAAVTLFAIGLNTLVVLQLDGLLLAHERREEAETIARLGASALGAAPDADSLRLTLSRIPGAIAAQVVDPSGRVLVAQGRPPAGMPSPDPSDARLFGVTQATTTGLVLEGGQLMEVSTPAGDPHLGNALVLWLRLGGGDAESRKARRLTLIYVALDALVAGAFGWYLIARTVVRPLRRLAEATRRVAEGDRQVRVPATAANELGDLSRDFNRMTLSLEEKETELGRQVGELRKANDALKSAREEVVQSEKLASVGRLAAGVAHELGNPVGAVTGYVSAMLRGRSPDPAEDLEMLTRIDREMKRIDRIIRDLLDFARPRSQEAAEFDLDETVDAAIAIVAVQKSFQSIEVSRRRRESARVRGDAHRLQQVVVNLLINAADAMEGSASRRITVETFRGEFPPVPAGRRREDVPPPSGPAVGLLVSDTGAGIAPQHLASLFDPFFTTKEPGRGTGLGLAISRTIVEAMGGRISAESEPGQGARFSVLLPPAV